jgi:hypothetical protein
MSRRAGKVGTDDIEALYANAAGTPRLEVIYEVIYKEGEKW